jgi:protein-disulfide isomerase
MDNICVTAALILLLATASIVSGQSGDPVLATAGTVKVTLSDLPPNAQDLYRRTEEIVAENRRKFLDQAIAEELVKLEAAARGVTPEKVMSDEFDKLPRPSDERITAVYEANRDKLAGMSEKDGRQQVIQAMMQEPAQKAEAALIASLKTKYKFSAGKDIGTAGLRSTEILYTIGTRSVTVGDFDTSHRAAIGDVRTHIYEELRAETEDALLNRLIAVEAAALGVETPAYVATEVTDKLRAFTDTERYELISTLQSKLFAKHKAVLLLKEPEPVVLNVSADDDPSTGPATAKVTVVAFVDYQCSACASFNPVMKKVLAEFGPRVRLVVRDFPLESIHPEAFRSALAANAAARQGKYFEYGSLLYGNQKALDDTSLLGYAEKLGLVVAKFKDDMADPKNADEVRKDLADGNKYGVSGTPTIYINGVKHHTLTESRFRESVQKAVNAVK